MIGKLAVQQALNTAKHGLFQGYGHTRKFLSSLDQGIGTARRTYHAVAPIIGEVANLLGASTSTFDRLNAASKTVHGGFSKYDDIRRRVDAGDAVAQKAVAALRSVPDLGF